MAIQYNTLGGTVQITPQSSAATVGFTTGVAIVGGYDANNAGSGVSGGSVETVGAGENASDLFGSSSELTRQIKTISGADTVYAVPLSETETTESFSSTQSGTLGNVPAMDPRKHPDHSITAQDDNNNTIDVKFVDTDSPSAPSDADTINLNPTNGDWKAKSSDTYDITYTYGDFSGAIKEAAKQPVRYVGVCTAADGPKSTLVTELETEAANFNFKRGVVGANHDIQSGSISSYTPSTEDWRLIEVAPARGSTSDGTVSTVGPLMSTLAPQPVDASGSVTYDSVTSLSGLEVDYTDTEAKDFDQVTALTRNFEVAGGVTTSSDTALRDIYVGEIVDLLAEELFLIAKQFAGGPQTVQQRKNLRAKLEQVTSARASQRPPALATGDGGQPYEIQVSQGSTDTVTDVTAAIEPAPIMKTVNLNINVGDVVTFDGVQ
jgi:hypothetical protein